MVNINMKTKGAMNSNSILSINVPDPQSVKNQGNIMTLIKQTGNSAAVTPAPAHSPTPAPMPAHTPTPTPAPTPAPVTKPIPALQHPAQKARKCPVFAGFPCFLLCGMLCLHIVNTILEAAGIRVKYPVNREVKVI